MKKDNNVFQSKAVITLGLVLILGLTIAFAEEIIIDVEGITSSKGNSGMTLNMTIITENGETWFMVYEDGLLVNTTELIKEYPIFSNLSDNSGINDSEEASFSVNVEDSNGTVYLNIDGTNYSSTLSSGSYEVNLNLSGGNYEYYWFSYGNDSYEEHNSSELRSFNVSMTSIEGLISHYKLDEASGVIIDSHGANNGTNNGATANVTGKIETAYNFDGSNDYINNLADVSSIGTGDFTINMWVNPNTLGTTDTFIDTGGGGAGDAEITARIVDSNGAVYFRTQLNSIVASVQTSSSFLSTGYWQMLTFRRDGTELSITKNTGTPVTDTGTVTDLSTTSAAYLGASTIGTVNFDGTIDEVGIWNRALTSDEIQALYNNGTGLTYPFE